VARTLGTRAAIRFTAAAVSRKPRGGFVWELTICGEPGIVGVAAGAAAGIASRTSAATISAARRRASLTP
jgi:hypothetical protein